MVDGDYVRLGAACHCGVLLPKRLGRGRPQKFCEEHKGKQRQKFEPRKCPSCLSEFKPVKYDQIYCGPVCKQRIYRSSKPADLVQEFKCLHCNNAFQTAAKSTVKYCSRLCKVHDWAKNNPEKFRAHRSKSATTRRFRLSSAEVEYVDPYKVFHLANWKCQICGVETPRSKRGTHDDDAPELDHIRPLAKGGEHSYTNTQCACRKCNGKKSDSWHPENSVLTQ